ncbi:hypothetical protein H6802_00500 [Candidatus Nomurabacteria bacterium]|mgnify:CR=1 FL=1|uniref:Glycosyltransferase 2-like domain-containing protein n=1 Tax=candidate division WWE3 bacterium TaxID=2053526 RepID=A0A955E1J6_UNCKA|nr:hypothetical protein [candidate division WWE3 bacterium]MCB9823429.1 hypothetical protein [Candidatus Nomurabacteria bacterium]MCB9827711.1 hypothetical protein [Candidatus Nomurabacteria bacterium]HXK52854.1 hypothetical protein [bacterium]
MVNKFALKYDKQTQRFFEILPGTLTWAMLLSPFWLGLLAPNVFIFYITFLTVLWVYLAGTSAYGVMLGYKKYQQELNVNWIEECANLNFETLPDHNTLPPSLKDLKIFVLIPVVNEPRQVLSAMLEGLQAQTFPSEQTALIFALEEKFAEEIEKTIRDLLKNDLSKFGEILFFRHPANIEGEVKGVAGPNRTWGAKHAVEVLKEKNENLRNYIFYTMDADHVLHEQFLARLAHLYLTSDKRDHKFYTTAVHLFNNNIWEVPTLPRIEANSITLGTLSEWAQGKAHVKDTFANYATSLTTLIDADYWEVKIGIIDDAVFFWRAFFVRKGDFIGVPHYIPFSADAVQEQNYLRTHKSMYKQLLRWGWGVVKVPMSLKGFLQRGDIPLSVKLVWTKRHLETSVIYLTTVYLMTFGLTLLTLVNPRAAQASFSYTLPDVVSFLLTVALVFFVPLTVFRSRIVKPIPKDWPLWRRLLVLFEGPMVVINLFTFSFLPFIEAQTRMMLGNKMKDLYHTPKVRK